MKTPGRGSAPEMVTVARIVTCHGVKGEVKVRLETDFPDRFQPGQSYLLLPPRGVDLPRRTVRIESIRPHQKTLLFKLEGVDNRAAAAALRGWTMVVTAKELIPLPAGHFYLFQLEGLEAQDEAGNLLGRVSRVLTGTGNDVYVIEGESGEILVPAHHEFVLSIDLDAGTMIIRPPQYYEARPAGKADADEN